MMRSSLATMNSRPQPNYTSARPAARAPVANTNECLCCVSI